VLAGVLRLGRPCGSIVTSKGIVPANTAAEIESAINKAVAGLDVQNALAGRLATMVKTDPVIRLATVSAAGPDGTEARPDYAQLRAAGIDTVIETAITAIGFDGCITHNWECPPPLVLHLFLRAQARLVRVADGAVLFERPLEYKSGNHELAHWLADGGQLLGEEFEAAYRRSPSVHDQVFHHNNEPFFISTGIPPLARAAHPEFQTFTVISSTRCNRRCADRVPRDIDRRELDPASCRKLAT
jgi:hypothetical protein